jgi:hypothetical protein
VESTEAPTRESLFTKDLKIFLSEEEDAWLAAEAQRRLNLLRAGDVEAALEGIRQEAHGGNRNVNKGMLIREAVERLREQTKP